MLKEGLNRQPICRCDQKIPPAQRSKEMLNSVGLEPTRNYPLAVSTGEPEASAITTRPTVRVVDQCNWWRDDKSNSIYSLIFEKTSKRSTGAGNHRNRTHRSLHGDLGYNRNQTTHRSVQYWESCVTEKILGLEVRRRRLVRTRSFSATRPGRPTPIAICPSGWWRLLGSICISSDDFWRFLGFLLQSREFDG